MKTKPAKCCAVGRPGSIFSSLALGPAISLILLLLLPRAFAAGAAGDLNAKLVEAAEEGDADVVGALLAKGADVNAQNSSGETALMFAAARGNLEVVRVLVSKGVDVNAKTTNCTPAWLNGWSALMYAANHGNREIVRVLLASGADVNVKADDGSTVLMQARNCQDIIVPVMATNATQNTKSASGHTALMTAVLTSDTQVVRKLLDGGEDVNAKTVDGGTALMIAAVAGDAQIVSLLLQKGANANARNNRGDTALMLAIEKPGAANALRELLKAGMPGRIGAVPGGSMGNSAAKEVVRALLEKGADVNARTEDGDTPLMYAAGVGDEQIAQMLLERGAEINAANRTHKQTALMLAAQNDHPDAALLLIGKHADVNAPNDEGVTPLMMAAYRGNLAVVKALLKAGAKPGVKVQGMTASKIAEANGHLDVVKALAGKK